MFVCYAWLLCKAYPALGNDQDIRFASMYDHHMVLQRAPLSASVWGFVRLSAGTSVRVTLEREDGHGKTIAVDADMTPFNTSHEVWKAILPPVVVASREDGEEEVYSSYKITALTDRADFSNATLRDVLFGEVWLCSGQSNMAFLVENAFGGPELVQDANNYMNIRLFTSRKLRANRPLRDLGERTIDNRTWISGVELPWSRASNVSISQSNAREAQETDTHGRVLDDNWLYMSAVCYLYGKELYSSLRVPIGLVSTNWGGTVIEAWSSRHVLETCGRPTENETLMYTELYNAMIAPFMNLTIRGAVWYQGESNSAHADDYACLLPQMVADWRIGWREGSGTTDPSFPFGVVQLAADAGTSLSLPYFRWAGQTQGHGSLPNEKLPNSFFATAYDLGDAQSPFGCVHTRYKKEVGQRLALAARRSVYGESIHVQPLARLSDVVGEEENDGASYVVRIPFDDSGSHGLLLSLPINVSKTIVATNWDGTTPFEVCVVDEDKDSSASCDASGQFDSWAFPTETSLEADASTIVLRGDGPVPLAVRYAWRAYPCEFEGCGVRSTAERIPPAPFHAYVRR